jgi:hypothetical protein
MDAPQILAVHRLAPAADEGRRRSAWPIVILRVAGQALGVMGRAFASPQVLWWLGLPWWSRWAPGNGTDGGKR